MSEQNVKLIFSLVFALIITGAMNLLNVCENSVDNYNQDSSYYDYSDFAPAYGEAADDGYSNKFFDNQAALCRGGKYMYQGNSPVAKMCQELDKTKEGRDVINQYNCSRGFNGLPRNKFEYSSNSDSNYEGIKCKKM